MTTCVKFHKTQIYELLKCKLGVLGYVLSTKRLVKLT
jgi:hypothetical protein